MGDITTFEEKPSEPPDPNLRFLTKDHLGRPRRGEGIEGRLRAPESTTLPRPLETLIGQVDHDMIHDKTKKSKSRWRWPSGGSKRRRIKPTKRKPITRKSTKRKSIKRKSIKRKSTKRKSTRKKLSKRRR